jgi:nucleotide-binding universal stress UspA family protein
MKHLLVPIDGSERSIKSVIAIKDIFSPSNADITLITVREDIDSRSSVILDQMTTETLPMLDSVGRLLPNTPSKRLWTLVSPVAPYSITQKQRHRYDRHNETDA